MGILNWVVCFLGSGLLGAVSSHAGEWPGLRGPHQDGVSQHETLAGDTQPPRVLWSRNLGQGYSSFAILSDRAYTQYQTTLGQYLICLDARTGSTLWETHVGDPYELVGIYPGPRSTPTIYEGVVYFTTPDGEVGAAEAASGRLMWKKSFQQELSGEGTEFGYSASPIIADGRVYLPIGGPQASIVAIGLPDGNVAWKSGNGPASYCSMLPISRSGHPLLVGYLQNELVILDRTTGKELWKSRISGGYDEHSAMPIDFDPLVIVSAPFQAGSTAYRIEWHEGSANPLRVEQAWQQTQLSLDVDSATRIADVIFGFDLRDPQSKAHRPSRGTYRALDANTGEVLWSSDTIGQANAVAVGNEMILLNDAGELIRASVDRHQIHESWRLKVFEDEVTWTPPALASGIVIVRSHQRAVAIRVGEPNPLDSAARVEKASWRLWNPRFHGLSAALLQGEREHPFMRPTWSELRVWYGQCLVVMLIPMLLFVVWKFDQARGYLSQLHWSLWGISIAGVVTTSLLNRFRPDQFSFTWPVTLFAAFQSCVIATQQVSKSPGDLKIHRTSRVMGFALVVLYLGYFLLLRQASLPHEWVFLMSPVPAAPVTIGTACLVTQGKAKLGIAAAIVVGFSCGYWGALLFPRFMTSLAH